MGVTSERNQVLLSMGYTDYRFYLNSPLWAKIRKKALKVAGYRCRLCGQFARVVHHTEYSRATLEGLTTKTLWALCHNCHDCIHDKDKHQPDSHETASRMYPIGCFTRIRPAPKPHPIRQPK